MTQVKICGITNSEDAACAVACGADAIGFIFYPRSPRYLTPDEARTIIKGLDGKITTVGVFVNEPIDRLEALVAACGLDMIQLHGDETYEYCAHFPPAKVIKAIPLRGEEDLRRAHGYRCQAILVDAFDPVRRGGTGERCNWELAAQIKRTHHLILAGGLSATNLREAIERCTPDAVDINSGVEISPGKKDHRKIKEVIEIVRCMGGGGAEVFRR